MKNSIYFIFISSGLVAQPEILWQFDMNDMAFGQAAAADVDGDGLLEVVFSTYRNDGMLYVLNGEDGSVLWQADVGGCADAAPLIADVDMDDDLEIVLAAAVILLPIALMPTVASSSGKHPCGEATHHP